MMTHQQAQNFRNQSKNAHFALLYGPDMHIANAIDFHATFPLSALNVLNKSRLEYPGGARKLCRLMKIWTKDMIGPHGLRHEFVQHGPHIACVRCHASVANFCGDGYLSNSKNTGKKRRAFSGPRIRGLHPQDLKKAVREIVRLIGYCEQRVIQHVMDS